MFSLLSVNSIYLISTRFEFAEHNLFNEGDAINLLNYSLVYLIFSYLLFSIGYFYVRGSHKVKINFNEGVIRNIDSRVLSILIYAGIALGAVNFIYNSISYNSGNVFQLLLDFGARNHRADDIDGYTILGYQFLLGAVFLYIIKAKRINVSLGLSFYLMCFFTFMLFISTGRIFNTLSTMATVFVFFYFLSTEQLRNKFINYLPFAVSIGTFLCVSLYVLRIASNQSYIDSGGWGMTEWLASIGTLLGDVAHLIIGKGNIPNIPALSTVIFYYGNYEDYLYGESFIYWSYAFIPNVEIEYLGHSISDKWYPSNVGGIPPTIMGELYANFGPVVGVFASFFLGGVFSLIYKLCFTKGTYIALIIYSALLFRFFFIVPKVESAALSNALWLVIIPVIYVFMGLIITAILPKKPVYE
ncbi:O-antigen polymerase [Pseudoalteromonas sp. ASV78]|uniref:O-antigen polymerase n=1 Tax=Pseudoalteromonas sp. ASV78 TaxID=3397851 RepID=UPI0039FC96AC